MGMILGIDQGSTKTTAIVADMEGNILGSGLAVGSNYVVNGMEHAMASVMVACKAALKKAGVGMVHVETLSAGMTGADWPEEYALLRNALCRATGVRDVRVYNDCIAALRGGTEHLYGAVICAGTGLNIGVRSPNGEDWAFGYYIGGDLQGASALGNHAIKAVFTAEAGIAQPTALTATLLNYYNETTVEKLLRKYVNAELSADWSTLALSSLAPIVLDIAASGDEAASAIATGFAQSAAKYVAAGLRRFGMFDLSLDVVLSGSVFKSKYMRDTTESAVHKACPGAQVVDALYEPVVGAALLALDHKSSGLSSDAVRGNNRRTSAIHGLLRFK